MCTATMGVLANAYGPVLQALGITVGGAQVAGLSRQLRHRVARPMSTSLAIVGGAAIGMAAGIAFCAFTRRSLAASVARASIGGQLTSATPAIATGEMQWTRLGSRRGTGRCSR